MQDYIHPLNADEVLRGNKLGAGKVLQEGDMYDSTTGKWEECPSSLLGSRVNGRSPAIWIRPATIQACTYCEDKKRMPTDIWAETKAMWQPCSECCKEEWKKFWALEDDQGRIKWFSDKAKVG